MFCSSDQEAGRLRAGRRQVIDGRSAKLVAWGIVAGLGLVTAFVLTGDLSPFQTTARVTVSVFATVMWAAVGWEVYQRPWASRRDEAQRLTNEAMESQDADPQRALILFAQAAALHSNQRTSLNLASALDRAGHLHLAKDFYHDAGAPGARDRRIAGESRVELARISLAERDWEWAEKYAQQALNALPESALDDRARAFITRSMARWQTGRTDEARAHLQQAIALAPALELQRTAKSFLGGLSISQAGVPGTDEWYSNLTAYRSRGLN